MNRRHYLALVGSVGSLAGCVGDVSQADLLDTPTSTRASSEPVTAATTATPTTTPPTTTSERTPSETPTEAPTPTDVPDPLGAWTDLEVAVYERVNREREPADLGGLAPDDHLLDLARTHTQAMIEWDRLAHEGPDGETHLPSSSYCSAATELLFGGQNTDPNEPDVVADQMVDLWMDSEGHRELILSPTYSHIGVGIAAADDTKFELYATMTLCLPAE